MVLSITLFRLSSIKHELVNVKEELNQANAKKYQSTLALQEEDATDSKKDK